MVVQVSCRKIGAAALGAGLLAASVGGASAQSCSAALGAYAVAIKADTVAALQGYLDQHAPCFEERVTARLETLRATAAPTPTPAPAPAAAPAPATAAAPAPEPDAGPVTLSYLPAPKNADVWIDNSFFARALARLDGISTEEFGGYVSTGDRADTLRRNAAQIGTLTISTMPPDFAGHALDLPMVTHDPAQARAMVDALRPAVFEAMLADGLALLAAAPVGMPVILACNHRLSRWEKLANARVGASGPLVGALRGGGVNVGQPTIFGLSPGEPNACLAADFVFLTTLEAHERKLSFAPAPVLGWGMAALTMSAEAWRGLTPGRQEALLRAARKDFEDPYWDGLEARLEKRTGCLAGSRSCSEGVKRGVMTQMADLPVDAWTRERLRADVLPAWEREAPPALVQAWKAAARQVLGLDLR